jgi:hypothetical protein
VLLLLPYEYGMSGLREKQIAWKGARLGLVLLAWLPLVVLILRQRPVGKWRWGLLGAWVPLAFALGVLGELLDTLYTTWEYSRRQVPIEMPSIWYDIRSLFSYVGTASTYAWLTFGYASLARRWWSALLIGGAAFGLMLAIDVVVLYNVTGPHRFH